jgi:hypothetical protein
VLAYLRGPAYPGADLSHHRLFGVSLNIASPTLNLPGAVSPPFVDIRSPGLPFSYSWMAERAAMSVRSD